MKTECNSVCRPAKVRKNPPLRAAKLTSAPSTIAHSYFIQPSNLMKWTGRTTLKKKMQTDMAAKPVLGRRFSSAGNKRVAIPFNSIDSCGRPNKCFTQ